MTCACDCVEGVDEYCAICERMGSGQRPDEHARQLREWAEQAIKLAEISTRAANMQRERAWRFRTWARRWKAAAKKHRRLRDVFLRSMLRAVESGNSTRHAALTEAAEAVRHEAVNRCECYAEGSALRDTDAHEQIECPSLALRQVAQAIEALRDKGSP